MNAPRHQSWLLAAMLLLSACMPMSEQFREAMADMHLDASPLPRVSP